MTNWKSYHVHFFVLFSFHIYETKFESRSRVGILYGDFNIHTYILHLMKGERVASYLLLQRHERDFLSFSLFFFHPLKIENHWVFFFTIRRDCERQRCWSIFYPLRISRGQTCPTITEILNKKSFSQVVNTKDRCVLLYSSIFLRRD